MALPFFYIKQYGPSQKEIELDEDTSRHVVQVLRMKEGERLNLTDGKGHLFEAEIIDAHKKSCTVKVIATGNQQPATRKITIAMSLLKNTSRFEWFLEKATEIGVSEIIPLVCERTEKQKFRHDRMKGICISAMLQSQQTWLPALHEPIQFHHFVIQPFDDTQKLVAHCDNGERKSLSSIISHHSPKESFRRSLILIGPEGDFTKDEIALALQNNFMPVSLGQARLRAETAGIVSATLLTQN